MGQISTSAKSHINTQFQFIGPGNLPDAVGTPLHIQQVLVTEILTVSRDKLPFSTEPSVEEVQRLFRAIIGYHVTSTIKVSVLTSSQYLVFDRKLGE